MKKILTFLLILILLAGAGAYFAFDYYNNSLEAVDISDDNIIQISIPMGSTASDIAEILFQNDLITNIEIFRFYAGREGYDVHLKAGEFRLRKSMNVDELLNALISDAELHSENTVNLTIIEGLILEDTVASVAEQLGLDYDMLLNLAYDASLFRDEFTFLAENSDIENLQGFLFPETYNLYADITEEEVIRFLLSQFEDYYIAEILPAIESSGLNLKELITLASIVEKEAVLKEERSTIAGVFLERLEIGMALESCATVNYILGEWKPRLSYEDISIDDPYNTYIYYGLPPSPINSPGKASITACLYPVDSEYLFFLAKGDGSHYFSETYEEHLEAAEKYLD